MTGWRVPLRLARREVLRRPGRTALVALLVAVPVAGMAISVTLIRSGAVSADEEWQRNFGQADAAFEDFGEGLAPAVPEGSRTLAVAKAFARVKAANGHRADVDITDLPLDDPMTAGVYDLVAGRPAAWPGEVVISTALADDLDVRVGETLRLERPALDALVVGEVEPVGCLGCGAIVVAPGVERAEASIGPFRGDGLTTTLIDLPDLDPDELTALGGRHVGALQVRALEPFGDSGDGGSDGVRWSLVIGAVALTVVAIVISAAFAVGARRQLVTLGQLSASGAPASTLRAALVLQGTVTGLVGAAGGLVLAAVLLVSFEGNLERILDRRVDGFEARPAEILVVVAIGVAAATAAALIPARTAARIPTLAAIAGRRPLPPVSRRLLTWGVTGVVVGLALLFIAVLGSQSGSSGNVWAFVAILGGVFELLGACAISPAIVSRLEPASVYFRGSLRLGARSLARHRARTGAVVSAVAAAAALAVVAGSLVLAANERSNRDAGMPEDVVALAAYPFARPGDDIAVPDAARSAVLDVLPGARVVSTEATRPFRPSAEDVGLWDARPADESTTAFIGSSSERALIATDALLDAIHASRELRDALSEHGVAVLSTHGGPRFAGDATIVLPDMRMVPGASVRHEFLPGYDSSFLITADKVAELGLETDESVVLIEAPEPLTDAQRGDLDDLRWDLNGGVYFSPHSDSVYMSASWEEPRRGPTPFQLELILTGVALLFSLFVVGVSLALAAAESKDERDILTIAGAPPNALARSAGARAWLLSVIGAAMAVPVGFLPVIVVSWATARNDEGRAAFPIVFPTRTVLLLVVAVPLAVSVVSWAASATAQRLRPVRISTATFE